MIPMKTTSRHLVCVYGDPDDRERVTAVAKVAFGAYSLRPVRVSNSFGRLLAIARFDWSTQSLVPWVKELSRRMPDVMFALRTEPLPEDPSWAQRLVLVGGEVVDEPEPTTTPFDDASVSVSRPEANLQVVARDDGSVDLAATVNATTDGLNSFIEHCEEYCMEHDGLNDQSRQEIGFRDELITTLESLLTPDELQRVERHREQCRLDYGRRVARRDASKHLQETVKRLAHPDVDCLLDEEDRRAICRLSSLTTKL
jgi:hypothetical protein